MRKLLLLPFLLLGCPVFGEVDFNGKMPEDLIPELREIIAAALESSDTMTELDFNDAQARGRRTAYKSAVLPSFNARVSLRQEKDDDTEEDASFEERLVYNITLSHPLYHWGSLKSEKQIGDIQYEMQQFSNEQRVDDFVMRIREDYLGLVVSKQRLEQNQIELEAIQKRLEFQRSQIEAGAAGENSINRVQLELDREELSKLREEADYVRRLSDFSLLVNMDPVQLEKLIAEEIPAFEILSEEEAKGIESMFVNAIETNDEIQRYELDIELEKRRLKIEETALRPKLDAQIGLSSNALDVDGTRREQAYSFFGVSVGWRIFDGFRTKGRTLEVLSRISAKMHFKDVLEKRLAGNLDMGLRKLLIEQKALTLQEWLLSSEKGQYDWIVENVEAERMSQTEAENAKQRFASADLTTQRSRISYLIALSQLAVDLEKDPLWDDYEAQ